jgi:hypothetical protein
LCLPPFFGKPFIKNAPLEFDGDKLRERWIVALGVFYFAILLGGALLTAQSVSTLGTLLAESRQHYTGPQATNITMQYVTVFHQDNHLYQGPYKPYIITTSLTAQDYRTNTSNSLQIIGFVNNTGDGTAYNAYLHVVAMNHEGKAVDGTYSFAGITSHMSLGIGYSFNYSGSPIINCTIAPVYTDLEHSHPDLP